MTEKHDPVRRYFERMAEIRSTGGATKETSYYSALENLLNELGALLDPKTICNGQIKNQGAGHPDFGIYTKKQCTKGEPKPGQIPERGVIEVKPLADNSWQTSQSAQATKYFNHYKLVLVTNYREFRLIGEDDAGNPVEREFFSLATDEFGVLVIGRASDKGYQRKRCPLLGIPSPSDDDCRTAFSARGHCLVSGILRPRCLGDIGRAGCDSPCAPAVSIGNSLGDQVRGQQGRALLSFDLDPNAFLRGLLRMGNLGKNSGQRQVRLEVGGLLSNRANGPISL